MHINENVKTKNCIVLQTRKGHNIENYVYDDLSRVNQNLVSNYKTIYPGITPRTEETGYYNCFGLAFACRRCFIEDDIYKILEDDGYNEIKDSRKVLPGDTIIYIDSNNDIIHCGIVIKEPNEINLFVALVYSKWGSFMEIIHKATQCPYIKDTKEMKYFRIYK